MLRNARAAIPDTQPLSANQIFRRQDKPRLPLGEVRELCEQLAYEGSVERVHIGYMVYYRHRARSLALVTWTPYNDTGRNKFFPPSTKVDWFASALYPLRQGKTVRLLMDDPRTVALKKSKKGKQERVIVLVPGQLIGTDSSIVLVSVLGKGSTAVHPRLYGREKGKQVADLVLAGMPAKLATTLMNELHTIYQE